MAKIVDNKVVVVTGGASGIGLNIVENVVKHGAKFVFIIDINEVLGNEAVKCIGERYGNNKVDFLKCDVASDLEKTFDVVYSKYKHIDLLVNNAGIGNESLISKTIDINVKSLMEWSVKFYDCMRKDRNGNGGTIINIASICGIRTTPFIPIYQASKFAVVGFTKSLGHEYNFRRSGVRVVAVCPGFTYTKMTENMVAKEDDVTADLHKASKSCEWQEVDPVGEGIIEVFAKADSGTLWVIEGSRSPVMVQE